MSTCRLLVHVVCLFLLCASASASSTETKPSQATLQIVNQSGRKIQLYWKSTEHRDDENDMQDIDDTDDNDAGVDSNWILLSDPYVVPDATYELQALSAQEFVITEFVETTMEAPPQSQATTPQSFTTTNNQGQGQFQGQVLSQQRRATQEQRRSNRSAKLQSSLELLKAKKKAKQKTATNNKQPLSFTISNDKDQIMTVTLAWQLEVETSQTQAEAEATQLVQKCTRQFTADEDIANCVQQQLTTAIEDIRRDISYSSWVRLRQAAQWEEYACEDHDLETSEALYEEIWQYNKEDYPVSVLHDYRSSQIHVLEDFISEEECRVVLQESRDDLHRAQIHNGRGGHRFSKHRRAWQAAVRIDWDDDHDHDNSLLKELSFRIYNYTNHVLGLNLTHDGQEEFTSIQYFGKNVYKRNSNDNNKEDDKDFVPDRYMPHCDDQCDGLPHKRGTRVATMVMYCEVPTVGGHTNFRNAGVHVQPQQGDAVFFSYIDPETLLKDNSFTSHSGCPVYEGAKRIVTQWMRFGVDEENPWQSFNTLGVQEEDTSDDESDSDSDSEDESDSGDEDDNNNEMEENDAED